MKADEAGSRPRAIPKDGGSAPRPAALAPALAPALLAALPEGTVLGGGGQPAWAVARADAVAFMAALPAESLDLVATDPAYSGMNEHMKFGRGRIVGRYSDPSNDRWMREFRDSPESFLHFLRLCERALKPGRHIYVMFDSFSLLSLGSLMRDVFDVKGLIAWDKVRLGMGHYFRRRHEFVVFASKGKRKLAHQAFPDVWRVQRVHRGSYPTQKPRELFEIMVAASTRAGEVVCDPFVGSGSAGVAALSLGRAFVGCDVDEKGQRVASGRMARYEESGTDPLQPESLVPPDVPLFWRRD